jgi:hypothetical protein
MIVKVAELIDRIKGAVLQRNIRPDSMVLVRVGDSGVEMIIEHVKVRQELAGLTVILQAKVRT